MIKRLMIFVSVLAYIVGWMLFGVWFGTRAGDPVLDALLVFGAIPCLLSALLIYLFARAVQWVVTGK